MGVCWVKIVTMNGVRRILVLILALLAFLLGVVGCERPDPQAVVVVTPMTGANMPPTPLVTPFSGGESIQPQTILPAETAVPLPTLPTYFGTPTPDLPHQTGGGSDQPFLTHFVTAGETLGYIAQLYGSSVAELQDANNMGTSDLLYAGQSLLVPSQSALVSPDFKLIPDSELVFGPAAADFNVRAYAIAYQSYLLRHQEEVEGRLLDGPEVVSLVAERYSVNPRLLLALLEYRAGWVTQPVVQETTFALGYMRPNRGSLYAQLAWAANLLNWGFYGRAEGGIGSFLVGSSRVAFAPTINHGTAGLQAQLGAHDSTNLDTWLHDVGPNGFFATFNRLFGNPFAYAVEPLIPPGLQQPVLRLPWSSEETWYYTGGPHGGWDSGSAWAALDFVPPGEQLGCVQSEAWVTAVADGLVVSSDFGAVLVDLDGDGNPRTGWAILYMHIETRDRIPAGVFVQAGDRIGHPSCEGGFSNGTHLHIARLYNGRWISADGSLPFEMGGWVSQGAGREYNGFLVRGGVSKEACQCREELNAIPGQ